MKEESLGLNHWLSFSATCHTVRPRSSALSSGHFRIAPPKSSRGMPRCFRYHAVSAALSPLLFKKTPPIPVIFAIVALLRIQPPDAQHNPSSTVSSCKPILILSPVSIDNPLLLVLRKLSDPKHALGVARILCRTEHVAIV